MSRAHATRRTIIGGAVACGLVACSNRQGSEPAPIAGSIDLLTIGPYPMGLVVGLSGVHLVRAPPIAALQNLLRTWFDRPVRLVEHPSDEVFEGMPAREREGMRQLDALAVLRFVQSTRRRDAACTLALTTQDLWAEDAAWVFGYADQDQRVGVQSLLRYDPGFGEPEHRPEDWREVVWNRSMRVVLHETEHLLGLGHCDAPCLMRETAGIDDVDSAPVHLCSRCAGDHARAHGHESTAARRARLLESGAMDLPRLPPRAASQ